MTLLEQLTKDLESAKQQMREKGEGALKAAFKSFFDKYDILESFAWTQYTPYFNDGDPCEFGVYDVNWINGFEEYDDDEEKGNVWLKYSWEEHRKATENQNAETRMIVDIKKFQESIPEELMQLTFGDSVKVIVNRDGSIETEEWYHD